METYRVLYSRCSQPYIPNILDGSVPRLECDDYLQSNLPTCFQVDYISTSSQIEYEASCRGPEKFGRHRYTYTGGIRLRVRTSFRVNVSSRRCRAQAHHWIGSYIGISGSWIMSSCVDETLGSGWRGVNACCTTWVSAIPVA